MGKLARRIAALAASCAVVCGCTTTVSGQAVAGSGRPAATLPISALDRLLLTAREINDVMRATGMTVMQELERMWDDSPALAERGCLAVWGPAQQSVYAGSGWLAVRGQSLREPDDDSVRHYASQAVVAFPTADVAQSFYDASTDMWAACANQHITYADPGRAERNWSFGEVTEADGKLTVPQTAEGGNGWSCQRGLTVRDNFAIDVLSCSGDPQDSAAADMLDDIAARLSAE